jgi:hypothetical protein
LKLFFFNITQIFASSIVGANSDGDNESQISSQEGGKKEVNYKVIGTLFDPEKNEKPTWVEEGLKVCTVTKLCF